MIPAAASMSRHEAAALLGVPEDASAADVQHAYLRAARRTHPDLLPLADEAGRRAAAADFDRLTRARAVLLEPVPVNPSGNAGGWTPGPEGPNGPSYRRVEGRGLAGSLVVLAMLAFLLVAIVTFQQGFGFGGDLPVPAPAGTSAP